MFRFIRATSVRDIRGLGKQAKWPSTLRSVDHSKHESHDGSPQIACDVCLVKQTLGQRPSKHSHTGGHCREAQGGTADWASGDAALAFHKKKRKRRPDDIVG